MNEDKAKWLTSRDAWLPLSEREMSEPLRMHKNLTKSFPQKGAGTEGDFPMMQLSGTQPLPVNTCIHPPQKPRPTWQSVGEERTWGADRWGSGAASASQHVGRGQGKAVQFLQLSNSPF